MDTSSPSPLTPSDGVSDEVCADATSSVTALYQAHADGGVIIGSQVRAGRERFGIFRGGKFTPLPALPVSVPVPAGVMDGTDAW